MKPCLKSGDPSKLKAHKTRPFGLRMTDPGASNSAVNSLGNKLSMNTPMAKVETSVGFSSNSNSHSILKRMETRKIQEI